MTTFICLMYHNLVFDSQGGYGVNFDVFANQIRWLIQHQFAVGGFKELETRLQADNLPDRFVGLTFDDGYPSFLNAAEYLRDLQSQGTFFLAKQHCQRGALTTPQIRTLANLCQVGAHTVTHKPLIHLSTVRIKAELICCKSWLEDVIGREVTAFSAPHGEVDQKIIDIAGEVGFSLVGNSNEWWNTTSLVRMTHMVNRIAIRPSFSQGTFIQIATQNRKFFWSRQVRSKLLAVPKAILSPDQIRKVNRAISHH